MRYPAGHRNRLLLGIGTAQFRSHRRARAGLQLVTGQVVVLDGLVGLEHYAGAGVDADDLLLEGVVGLEVGNAHRLDVLRDDQADLGVLEVRAVVDHVVLVLGPVLAMGHRQPGRQHGIELAGCHALPHDPGGHGLQLHVVAEFLLDHFGGHVGGRHAVGPTIHVTNAYFFGHCLCRTHGQYHGGAHTQETSHSCNSSHQSIPSSGLGICIIVLQQ
ncbi:hypothetical protein D3C72_1325570 [compost metagenome]